MDQARRDLGIGVSEAVNELIRRGLMPREDRPVFRQRTRRLGLRVDVSNVSAALEDRRGREPIVLVDANIILYAVDEDSPFHADTRGWLESALNGSRRVGIPWSSYLAFVRISTHPRALREPLSPAEAWQLVEEWLDAPATWVPEPGRGHRDLLGALIIDLDLHGNLVSDASLAALCLEHGLQMVSADSDFARFTDVTWVNPVSR